MGPSPYGSAIPKVSPFTVGTILVFPANSVVHMNGSETEERERERT